MKFNEIKTGQFFTIDNTPSYPKLKTDYGYIDVRDEIKKEAKDLPWGLELMTDEGVLIEFKQYGFKSVEDIRALNKELLNK